MRNLIITSPDSYRSMAWRNGLGHTVEIAKRDLPEGGAFAWRLSMADVTEDGEFSNFSGYDRTLLLLTGAGMTLQFANGRCFELTAPLQAVNFKGDEPTFATLHEGPIKDFNVMCRHDCCRAEVVGRTLLAEQAVQVCADELLIYVVGDELTVCFESAGEVTVPGRHLLSVCEPDDQTLQCRGGEFIAVQITYL